MPKPLDIANSALQAMQAHASRTFPEECCGIMLGQDHDDGHRAVVDVIAVDNTKDENRKRRYLIEPEALLAAERTARQAQHGRGGNLSLTPQPSVPGQRIRPRACHAILVLRHHQLHGRQVRTDPELAPAR